MPKITKPLTDTEIKNAKAKTKQYNSTFAHKTQLFLRISTEKSDNL